MADRSYPIDAIGNAIRKGDLVRVSLREAALNFRVADVQPAGTIESPSLGGMALHGTITLVAHMPVQYGSDSVMVGMLVLREPEPPSAITQ